MKKTIRILISTLLVVVLAASCLVCFSACNEEPPVTLAENRTYRIDNETSVFGVSFLLLKELILKENDCYVQLNADGTMKLRLMLKDGLQEALPSLITTLTGQEMDVAALLSTLDLTSAIKTYVEPIVPGFTLDDIPGGFALLEKSLGVGLVGVDWESDEAKALCASVKNTKRVPADFEIPDGLGIEYNGPYHIETLTSSVTGESYKTVFVGKDEEPFLMLTLTEEEGRHKLTTEIMFIQVKIVAYAD